MESSPGRDPVIDWVRGAAIVGMVIDHAALVAAASVDVSALHDLRSTVTRFVMPVFMIVAGHLLAVRAPSVRRVTQVAAAGAVISGWGWLVDHLTGGAVTFDHPDVVLLLAGVLVTHRLVRHRPLWCVAAGWVQGTFLPVGWHGYEPGAVLLLVAVGVLAARAGETFAGTGPLEVHRTAWWFTVLEKAGQVPLRIYVTHLLVLGAVAVAVHG